MTAGACAGDGFGGRTVGPVGRRRPCLCGDAGELQGCGFRAHSQYTCWCFKIAFCAECFARMSCSRRLAGGATAFTWLSLCQTTRGSLCPAATSAVSGRCRGRRPPQIPPTIRAALRPASRTRLPSTRSSRHCPCRAGAAGIPESARAAPRSAPPCAGKTRSLRPTTCSPLSNSVKFQGLRTRSVAPCCWPRRRSARGIAQASPWPTARPAPGRTTPALAAAAPRCARSQKTETPPPNPLASV